MIVFMLTYHEYLTIRTMEYFKRQAELGRIRPRVSVEELLSYIAAAYTGIQTECIVSNCYRHERYPFVDLFQPEIQFRTLAMEAPDSRKR